jgi:putative protein-disulfide isomerase
MHLYITTLITIGCLLSACSGSNLHIMSAQNSNPLLCDIETGLCELPGQAAAQAVGTQVSPDKTLRIVYFTDPICSSCWGIEPQLRKLKLAYGHALDIEYRMGGLLPDWSYNSGGISRPSDVAHHWDEVSLYYDMPIDGDVWLEDPLHSSYPPSIAFKAAQLQDEGKAILFLRLMGEQVFLKKIILTGMLLLDLVAGLVGLFLSSCRQICRAPPSKPLKRIWRWLANGEYADFRLFLSFHRKDKESWSMVQSLMPLM